MSVWEVIRKEWGLVNGMISIAVGNRLRVKFWKDK